jgi:sugar phosphate isomerase/epimerase
MNRRQFISRSAAAVAAGAIANQELFAGTAAAPNKGRIGIQLYSIKDELPKDFEGSLKKLSDIGYSQVEPYGFNGDKFLGKTMKELSDIVKDMGMSITGTHCGGRMLGEDINAPEGDMYKKIAAELKSGGGMWAIHASLPGRTDTLDNIKRICAHFNRVGEVCNKAGAKFAFHNHAEVFSTIGGEVVFDYLIKNTDPNLVFFQMDLGHTVNGGGISECIHYASKYSARIPLWHASDFNLAWRQYRELGKGHVPYKELFELPNTGGLQQLSVEQETGGDIFASCKVDFDFLKQFKWTGV